MSVKRYTYRYSLKDGELYKCEEPNGMYVLHSDYAALLVSYNALREAVAWLLEVQGVVDDNIMCPNWRRHVGISDIVRNARAEVDRLLENES